MTAFLVGLVASGIGYLIGGIPFGYLVARWVKGIDIRTVGSGNIGATNVGRTLGFRYFLLVFALDMAKGLLPTLFLARGLSSLSLPTTTDLPVFIGLAAILGHNFPVYLRFKGGKGVATSLGVLIALDAPAALAAVVGFVVFLGATGFVSLSSILGGVCFVGVHFMRVEDPFSRSQIVMSIITLGLLGLVVTRHRGNLKRIAAGTEPKIKLRKRREGFARTGIIVATVAVAGAIGLGLNALRKNEVTVGDLRIKETARLATGHQRADRMLFLDQGRLLAVTCPRYGHVVLAALDDLGQLRTVKDIALTGRPVALATDKQSLYVLQRPHGDARHLEEAYWDTFDFQGQAVGTRFRLGYDPDDIVISRDGRHAFVLTSGHAEGETNRPDPALTIFRLGEATPTAIGRLEFKEAGEDPARLAISADARTAAVSMQGTRQIAWLDLQDPEHPSLSRREPISASATPEGVWFDQRDRLWLTDPDGSMIGHQQSPGGPMLLDEKLGNTADIASLATGDGPLVVTLPRSSAVELLDASTAKSLGRLPIRGTANLGTTRPLGLAVSHERGMMAVSNRAGGGIHLFRVTNTSTAKTSLVDASEPQSR